MAYGFGIAVSITLVLAAIENYRLRGIETEARQVAVLFKESALARDKAAGNETARKPNAELEIRVRELEAQLKGRQEIVDALRKGLVGTTAGFSEYMRVFARQSLPGVWLTGFDIAAGGDDLTIAGRALSPDLVPAYLQRLNREAPTQGRQFASISINQASARQPLKIAPERQEAKEPNRRPSVTPHVEFVISSTHPDDKTRLSPPATPQRDALPSLSLRAPVEDAARGVPNAK
jgi:hypothetical protein